MQYKITLTDSIVLHEELTAKKKKSGKGEPTVKITKGDSLTRDTGDWATKEQIIDAENYIYDKVVRNSKGEIIHEEHVPLRDKK